MSSHQAIVLINVSSHKNYEELQVFMVSILRSTPNHTHPNNRCLIKNNNQVTPTYLKDQSSVEIFSISIQSCNAKYL